MPTRSGAKGWSFICAYSSLNTGTPDGRIGRGKHLVDVPVGGEAAAGAQHRPHRVLQAMTIAGALVDRDIGQQAEHRAAPIGAPPGVIMIQPRSLRPGQAARH